MNAKPDLKLIQGSGANVLKSTHRGDKLIETVDTPERVEFNCHHCKGVCQMYPRAKPIAVQHAIPACEAWTTIEAGKDDLERFLIKCGVHVLVPEGKA